MLEAYEAPCLAVWGVAAMQESLAATEHKIQESLLCGEALESPSADADTKRMGLEDGKKKAKEERRKRPRE